MTKRPEAVMTRKKILSVSVRLFLTQGYRQTSVSQIVEEAGVARGSFQNFFPTKDCILKELVISVFGSQFVSARALTANAPSPICEYAAETAIQLAITELNENLRELYLEAYSVPDIAEFIYLNTSAELKRIFGAYHPGYSDCDFYETDIGTSGIMRNYMARKCDIHFPLERKIDRFITAALRVLNVPADEFDMVMSFVKKLDIRQIANDVIEKLFTLFEVKFDFTLSKSEET